MRQSPALALTTSMLALSLAACGPVDDTDDPEQDKGVSQEQLTLSGWHSEGQNCDEMDGTGGLFSDNSVCLQAFIKSSGGKIRGKVMTWVSGGYLEFYEGTLHVVVEKPSGLNVGDVKCHRTDYGMDKYTAGGVPLDTWECNTASSARGMFRVKGTYNFDIKSDGHDNKTVVAPTSGYYKNP
ncbi:MAG: hypothetical protein K1X89_25160 [Myxococcaceae bacterium]|nr:hypothetical protein [Myxococcaceae bacterium]